MRSPGSFALLQATQTEHFGILLGVELIGEMHRMERGPMTRCRGLFGTTGLFALLFTWGAAPLPAQAPRPVHFLATHYDVSAALDTIGTGGTVTLTFNYAGLLFNE